MNNIEHIEDLPSKWTSTISGLTDLTLLLCKEEKYHSSQEGENNLCKLLQEQTAGRAFCEQDCTVPLVQAVKKGEAVYFKCYAHLNNVAIPFYSNGDRNNGFLILGGRVVSSYDDLVGYRGVAEKLGCEPSRVLEIAKGVSFKDVDSFKSSAESVRMVTDYLIKNAGSYKRMEDDIAKLNTIIKVATAITTFADSKEFCNTILNTIGVLFNVRTTMLLVREGSGDSFKAAGAFGYEKGLLEGFSVSRDEGLIKEAVVRNEVVSSSELLDMLNSGFPNGFTSVKIFPISAGNIVEGLIVILNTPISSHDEDLLRAFCNFISLAIDNRHILLQCEAIEKICHASLHALYSIETCIDSADLFNIIIEKAAEIVGAEQGSLMLLNEEGHEIEVKATKGLNQAILSHVRIRPGEGIAGSVLEKGMPLVVSNIEEDKRTSRSNRVRYKTKSFISMPLKVRDKCIGLLNLADKADGSEFSDKDIKILEAIALYSAVAIERRVYYQSSVNLRKISITDSLTGLLNRRYFEERISEEMERSKRHGQPFSLIILDIDDFKRFNDTYGHLCGDEALKNTANEIRRCVRIIDIAARYGGEEFAIILPTTEKEDAGLIGERIRSEIEGMPFNIKEAEKAVKQTVSLGIASYPGDASSVEELINNADRALYRAKGLGKNRVVIFGNL